MISINLISILTGLQILSLLTLIIFLIFSISNLWALRKLEDFPNLNNKEDYPMVSILIPARDEELNIKKCVKSLLNQNYPNYELLVLNDNSSDKTEEILKKIKIEFESSLKNKNKKNKVNFNYFNGKKLPDDWLGKHWACHQLEQKSQGELILFIDADTWHHPDTLKVAVNSMLHEKANFITVLPKEEANTFAEELSMPLIPWSLQTFMPLVIAKRSRRPALSATIGQFMLFDRKSYHYIGGYPSIRDKVLDDVTFGRKIKSFGLKWRIYDGKKYVNCRMYRNFKDVFDGLTRSIYPVFKSNIFYFGFSILFLAFTFIAPWMIISLSLLQFALLNLLTSLNLYMALFSTLITTITWIISNYRFKYSQFITLIHPLIIITMVYLAVHSMIKSLEGSVTWKGRKIKFY